MSTLIAADCVGDGEFSSYIFGGDVEFDQADCVGYCHSEHIILEVMSN